MQFLFSILFAGLAAQATPEPAYGLKTFREIYSSLSVVTAIKPDSQIQEQYRRTQTRLPNLGEIEEYTSVAVRTANELAAFFCQRRITEDSKIENASARWAHRQVDFSSGPRGLTDTIKQSVIGEYARLYWQREPSEIEVSLYSKMMSDLIEGLPNSPDQTQMVLRLACASFLSSIEFLKQ